MRRLGTWSLVAVVFFAVWAPREAEAGRWRDCKIVLATALAVGFVAQEVNYGAVQRVYRSYTEWSAEQERLAQEKREREAQELQTIQDEITALRKDPKTREAYLAATFERLLQERNEMAATGKYREHPTKPKWDYLNARLITLKEEMLKRPIEELMADIATAEKALPRSLKYEADQAALEAKRAELLSREVAAFEDKFFNGPLKNVQGQLDPNASAKKYLAEWPRP